MSLTRAQLREYTDLHCFQYVGGWKLEIYTRVWGNRWPHWCISYALIRLFSLINACILSIHFERGPRLARAALNILYQFWKNVATYTRKKHFSTSPVHMPHLGGNLCKRMGCYTRRTIPKWQECLISSIFSYRTCWAKDEPKDLFHKHRQDYNSFVKVKISPVGPAFARNFFIQTISSKLGGFMYTPAIYERGP